MKAAVLHGPNDMRLEDIPAPVPRDGEVLIKILMNGICGSDIHFFKHGELGPFRVTEPYVPGHEACGEVVDSNGTNIANGQRVAIEPGIPCRKCLLCRTGRYNLCRDVVFLSAPPVDGTFAEYVAIPADFAHPLPDYVDDEAGAFIEPVSVAVQACNRCDLKAGNSVAIVGAGPIGLVTYLVARAYGAHPVYCIDGVARRLDLAAGLGADGAVNFKETEPVKAVTDMTSGGGVDVVFDTSGSSGGCASTTAYAKRGGKVVLVGWPELSPVGFFVEQVIEKELNIYGVNRYCNTYPTAVSLMASGVLKTAALVSHRYPFDKICEAMAFASENREQTLRVMVSNKE